MKKRKEKRSERPLSPASLRSTSTWHPLPFDWLPNLIEKTKLEERNRIVSFLRSGEGFFDDQDDIGEEARIIVKDLAAAIASLIEKGRHEQEERPRPSHEH